MKAHDVRHLTLCHSCDEIGDDRNMIECRDGAVVHLECAFMYLGRLGVQNLPPSERAKLRLCDVPVDVMRGLLAK